MVERTKIQTKLEVFKEGGGIQNLRLKILHARGEGGSSLNGAKQTTNGFLKKIRVVTRPR